MTWDDPAWLRSITDLPMLLKGICDPDDVRRARDQGIDGIYCSNHGGRQANGGLPALQCLPDGVDAAGDMPGAFDSGIREHGRAPGRDSVWENGWIWVEDATEQQNNHRTNQDT